MKTEVIIWDGKARIVLYAENEFEKDLVEKIKDSKIGYEIHTNIVTEKAFNEHSRHRIEVNLTEKTKSSK